MTANEDRQSTDEKSSEQNEQPEAVDWEEVGRDLLAVELQTRGDTLRAELCNVSRSVRRGEPLTERQLQEVAIEVEALVSTLEVLDASPFGAAEKQTPQALDRLLSEVEQ